MGTPFISCLQPQDILHLYTKTNPHTQQPPSIPKTFLDAMSVRESVYVTEQKIPLENEFDSDDPRSCHWVIYASVNKTDSPAVLSPSGTILRPRRSTHLSLPIGTIRLVPFPHPPHPQSGGIYIDGQLTNPSSSNPPSPSAQTPSLNFKDRPTTFHDGLEPYIKLGRLAVLPEFRRMGIASQLIRASINWMQENHTIFNPRPSALGFEALGMDHNQGILPKWRGLICVHAQETAVSTWEKFGFEVDKEMGTWFEEGIPHVGMWRRVKVGDGGGLVESVVSGGTKLP
ncbi:acyl-CoA N-acyltransferase [Podospora fimiseda]|uniref:Acyl-CoA N-acyltransferase n=1 Tax=Podospora fimiseda TaxID=252190 RepID=A0AAN7BLK0_9PEZI|nr:acyl-CoA N-acyltransferase [Podospora fimiseda]